MKDKSNQFRHESLQDTNAVVKYLKALAEGIEKGTLQFRDEESEIVLEPGGMIRFGLEAQKKSDRYALSLKMSWKQRSSKRRDPGPLRINGFSDDGGAAETAPGPAAPSPTKR